MALWSSIRFSLRILWKHWKLTSIAVSSVAVAMAAGTTGFSVFNALLWRPPAVLAPKELLTGSTPAEEFGGFCYADYTFYRDHNGVLSGLMAFRYSISLTPIASQPSSVSWPTASTSIFDEPPRPFVYFNLNQHYQSVVYLLARTKGRPRQWLPPLSEALEKVVPGHFLMNLTLDDWLDFALFVPRITLFCIVGFAGLAFMLSSVGLYGAVFYSVSERKKELGIRAALGASPRDLWNMILRQTSLVTATGVCLGMFGGITASLLVRSLLYGIHAVEWIVFSAVALTMGLMTVLTAYFAARGCIPIRWSPSATLDSSRSCDSRGQQAQLLINVQLPARYQGKTGRISAEGCALS